MDDVVEVDVKVVAHGLPLCHLLGRQQGRQRQQGAQGARARASRQRQQRVPRKQQQGRPAPRAAAARTPPRSRGTAGAGSQTGRRRPWCLPSRFSCGGAAKVAVAAVAERQTQQRDRSGTLTEHVRALATTACDCSWHPSGAGRCALPATATSDWACRHALHSTFTQYRAAHPSGTSDGEVFKPWPPSSPSPVGLGRPGASLTLYVE